MNQTTRPRGLMGRLLLLAVMLVPLGLSLACATGGNSRDFPDHLKISYRGGEVDPQIWESARNAPEESLPYRNRTLSWVLPMTLYQRGIQFESPERIHVRSTAFNDLAVPFFLLPLRFHYSESLYSPESALPQSTQWVTMNPLWATSYRDNWPEDRGRIRARGVPLFFGRVDVDSDDQRIGFFNTLWSLGPAYLRLSDPDVAHPAGSGSIDATVGMPLALGGIPGGVLWFDAELDARNPNESMRYSAHGPLFGLLGYTRNSVTERVAEDLALEGEGMIQTTERRTYFRLVTFGLLWMSTGTEIAEKPRSEFSAHGPLFGVFGWGKSKGRNAVRLLWIPIPVQSSASVGE